MLMRFSTPSTNVVWITKYRYKVLNGRVAERTRDLIRKICESRDVLIVRGAVSPAKLVQYIKGRSSRSIQYEFSRVLRLLVACQPHRLVV